MFKFFFGESTGSCCTSFFNSRLSTGVMIRKREIWELFNIEIGEYFSISIILIDIKIICTQLRLLIWIKFVSWRSLAFFRHSQQGRNKTKRRQMKMKSPSFWMLLEFIIILLYSFTGEDKYLFDERVSRESAELE
jgi:hypothetical protein